MPQGALGSGTSRFKGQLARSNATNACRHPSRCLHIARGSKKHASGKSAPASKEVPDDKSKMDSQRAQVKDLVSKAEEAIFADEKWSKGGCASMMQSLSTTVIDSASLVPPFAAEASQQRPGARARREQSQQ